MTSQESLAFFREESPDELLFGNSLEEYLFNVFEFEKSRSGQDYFTKTLENDSSSGKRSSMKKNKALREAFEIYVIPEVDEDYEKSVLSGKTEHKGAGGTDQADKIDTVPNNQILPEPIERPKNAFKESRKWPVKRGDISSSSGDSEGVEFTEERDSITNRKPEIIQKEVSGAEIEKCHSVDLKNNSKIPENCQETSSVEVVTAKSAGTSSKNSNIAKTRFENFERKNLSQDSSDLIPVKDLSSDFMLVSSEMESNTKQGVSSKNSRSKNSKGTERSDKTDNDASLIGTNSVFVNLNRFGSQEGQTDSIESNSDARFSNNSFINNSSPTSGINISISNQTNHHNTHPSGSGLSNTPPKDEFPNQEQTNRKPSIENQISSEALDLIPTREVKQSYSGYQGQSPESLEDFSNLISKVNTLGTNFTERKSSSIDRRKNLRQKKSSKNDIQTYSNENQAQKSFGFLTPELCNLLQSSHEVNQYETSRYHSSLQSMVQKRAGTRFLAPNDPLPSSSFINKSKKIIFTDNSPRKFTSLKVPRKSQNSTSLSVNKKKENCNMSLQMIKPSKKSTDFTSCGKSSSLTRTKRPSRTISRNSRNSRAEIGGGQTSRTLHSALQEASTSLSKKRSNFKTNQLLSLLSKKTDSKTRLDKGREKRNSSSYLKSGKAPPGQETADHSSQKIPTYQFIQNIRMKLVGKKNERKDKYDKTTDSFQLLKKSNRKVGANSSRAERKSGPGFFDTAESSEKSQWKGRGSEIREVKEFTIPQSSRDRGQHFKEQRGSPQDNQRLKQGGIPSSTASTTHHQLTLSIFGRSAHLLPPLPGPTPPGQSSLLSMVSKKRASLSARGKTEGFGELGGNRDPKEILSSGLKMFQSRYQQK